MKLYGFSARTGKYASLDIRLQETMIHQNLVKNFIDSLFEDLGIEGPLVIKGITHDIESERANASIPINPIGQIFAPTEAQEKVCFTGKIYKYVSGEEVFVDDIAMTPSTMRELLTSFSTVQLNALQQDISIDIVPTLIFHWHTTASLPYHISWKIQEPSTAYVTLKSLGQIFNSIATLKTFLHKEGGVRHIIRIIPPEKLEIPEEPVVSHVPVEEQDNFMNDIMQKVAMRVNNISQVAEKHGVTYTEDTRDDEQPYDTVKQLDQLVTARAQKTPPMMNDPDIISINNSNPSKSVDDFKELFNQSNQPVHSVPSVDELQPKHKDEVTPPPDDFMDFPDDNEENK